MLKRLGNSDIIDISKGVVGTWCDDVNIPDIFSGFILNDETYLWQQMS